MSIVTTLALESNRKMKFNFDGGNLSSDAGLILLKEFIHKFGIEDILNTYFKTKDAAIRKHTDVKNLLQVIYQISAAYFEDDCADELTHDPVMQMVLNKDALASQPTLSRFYNRMDETTLEQLSEITYLLRKRVYQVEKPEVVLLDLDSTLLETYGTQEGQAFNFHYHAKGYHPLVCFDGMTGDLLKIALRNGNDYSGTGVEEFLQPLLNEFLTEQPDVPLFLRADSGFAKPALYEQCESNGISYAIRLKENNNLRKLAENLEDELSEITAENTVDYAVVYGEFTYQANSWAYPRKVVCKIEKPMNQFTHLYTFIVTNINAPAEKIIRFYCKRGAMENFIKECKNGFDFNAVSSSSMIVNSNRLQIRALTYNIFNWFKRLVLPESMKHQQVDTIRLKLIKIAAKVVHSARYVTFKLCSSCPYKDEFYATLHNIRKLKIRLE